MAQKRPNAIKGLLKLSQVYNECYKIKETIAISRECNCWEKKFIA